MFYILTLVKSESGEYINTQDKSITQDSKNPPLYQSPTPTIPVIQRQEHLSEVIAGKSTKEEIIKTLGTPSKSTEDTDFTKLFYNIPATNRSNTIYLKNDTAEYILEEIPIDNNLHAQFSQANNFLVPEGLLYDHHWEAGFRWSVFADRGIAFLSNPTNGYTIEILYFIPMNISDFDTSVAPIFSLSTTQPRNEERF